MNTDNLGGGNPACADVPVLIAGGGPVGLALAVELGRRDIECVLVEKRDGSVPVPKMSQVSTRAMEFCRRWGIAEEVKKAVWSENHALDFVYLTSLTGHELMRQKVPSYAERGQLPYTPEGPSPCPQIYFDPILAARAKSFPSVTLRYNTGLDSFEHDADCVRAVVSDTETGKRETLTAGYLVGCDGPGGVVRAALGIELGGLGAIANSINIFFRSIELATRHDKGWARFYRLIDGTGCWAELIAIDGRELWRLTVFHETARDFDADAFLRRAMGCDFAFELISVLPWERRDYVAERYFDGRVLIAGDAAHQCSPTGGLGMHMGLAEAVNIAWKLEAMIDGWGGSGLLDSYEAERQPLARHNVDISTLSYQNITGIPGSDAFDEDSAEGERQRKKFAALGSNIIKYSVNEFEKNVYGYDNSPICVLEDGPAAAPEGTTQTARPGMRAPHGWIGEGRSTLDLFGDGFTLLGFGTPPVDGAGLMEAAAARRVPLKEVHIDDAAIAGLYETRLVLVRPDDHVAWRGDSCPSDPLGVIDRVRGAAAGSGNSAKSG
jgi:2-polyprenyl-6-methoxyphenol hydroxylase-like FAD-dependent oxidoreductase